MLTKAQISEFRERGFLHFGSVMSKEQAAVLKQRLDDVLDGRSAEQPELKHNMLGERNRSSSRW